MVETLFQSLPEVLQLQSPLPRIAGIGIGFVVGILPGLGSSVTIALPLPFPFDMDPVIEFTPGDKAKAVAKNVLEAPEAYKTLLKNAYAGE